MKNLKKSLTISAWINQLADDLIKQEKEEQVLPIVQHSRAS